MTSPQPILDAIDSFKETLEELKRLYNKSIKTLTPNIKSGVFRPKY